MAVWYVLRKGETEVIASREDWRQYANLCAGFGHNLTQCEQLHGGAVNAGVDGVTDPRSMQSMPAVPFTSTGASPRERAFVASFSPPGRIV